MCGIFFSLSTSRPVSPNDETCCLLRNRGPDSFQEHTLHQDVRIKQAEDQKPVSPIVDGASQSVLCWNGDAWKYEGEPIRGNDAQFIFNLLLQAANSPAGASVDDRDTVQRVLDVIGSTSGPFAFVFYDAVNLRLYFGRDCLGRRSLLQGLDDSGALKICSICDGTSSTHFEEIDTDGVHMVDLTRQKNPIPRMNKSIPESIPPRLSVDSPSVSMLEQKIRKSLALRIQNVREPPGFTPQSNAKVAVLFSGGLDCTLLARLSHELLPVEETIDLLNVAFENPRVAAAAAAAKEKEKGEPKPTLSIYESCPDRMTGRAAFSELQLICPDRNWRFVAIDIPYVETVAHRDTVKRLMRPHNTEMDLSIACALYFASRGKGTAIHSHQDNATAVPYTTPARVLLSGLGADELFAGYSRHGVAFSRNGFEGLIDEIDLDVSRLGKRNLGRDNRVLAHWEREARFPYLDEDFVSWVVQMPVWEKCGFGVPETDDAHDGLYLDSEKKSLRLVALRLGMVNVSREKKRAIQFGSRTAKMEKGRTKGTDALS
ncbi:hypothetical protein FE257_000350 [Aspergillus nanangensis]|uniref:Asparagine synthase related protein n=1 Tax=Aspergillus nanangensis TaxID=2582783 RepID=A0AAD4CZB5_ASPNN|nr:hypothetical protein FE257_000350 [Aspergillus nanangensis]